MKSVIRCFTVCSVLLLSSGCASVISGHLPMTTVDELVGEWAGFAWGIGYCVIEINADGTGDGVVMFSEDDIEVFHITSLSFPSTGFIIHMTMTETPEKEERLQGELVWGTLYLTAIQETQNSDEEPPIMQLMRTSEMERLYHHAQQVLKSFRQE